MSWMTQLYQTYEQAARRESMVDGRPIPVSHTVQNAHINIVVDIEGNFLRAKVLEKTQIVLPATERSAGRSSGEAPHPLADKIQYVAGDYEKYGGLKMPYFKGYKKQLAQWVDSEFSHPSLLAVYNYICKRRVVVDLLAEKTLWADNDTLLTSWSREFDEPPAIFKVLPKEKGQLDQGNALVCWSVESSAVVQTKTWEDAGIQDRWIKFDAQQGSISALCYVSGDIEPIALNHPAKLRHSGDKAKLISSNDLGGYTFKGRFTDSKKSLETYGLQAAAVGSITSQKAHNALRWLISRQGKRNDDQVIVAWAVSATDIPQPTDEIVVMDDAYLDDFGDDQAETDPSESFLESDFQSQPDQTIDLGARYAKKLKRYMNGYRETLEINDTVSVMAIDSATPGRMGIVYYRESMPTEYLDDITAWHENYAWPQRSKKEITFKNGKTREVTSWPIQAPAPYNILNAVYGDVLKSNKPLAKQLYQRLLPCLLERASIPEDILKLAHYQACKTSNKEYWEWERNIGVACALYKGNLIRHSDQSKRRTFTMALDTSITSRDYLYGRLLAIAEKLEDRALRNANVSRPTTANRLMQRFSDRPYSTWLTIYKHLDPYMKQLNTDRWRGFLENRNKEIDQVMGAFEVDEFKKDEPLKGEFLLGFHCQRLSYRTFPQKVETINESELGDDQ